MLITWYVYAIVMSIFLLESEAVKMKTYIVIKKGETTKIIADSIEDAIEIYNDSLVKDALENYGQVLSKLKEIEHRYNSFRETQNKRYHEGSFPKSVLEAFKRDSDDIKGLLNDAESRFNNYKSKMIKSLDSMYNALTKVNW